MSNAKDIMTRDEYLEKIEDGKINVETEELTTDIAVISSGNSLAVTPKFQDVLDQIPVQLAECNRVLDEYRKSPDEFFDNHSEEEIDGIIKDLRDLNGFTRNVKKSRQSVKKFLDERRDVVLGVLDFHLEQADFAGLETAEQDMKKMKNDLNRYREDRRWGEIEEVFNDCFSTVEGMTTKNTFPDLADFGIFKNRYSDLVSGAKTKPVTNATKQRVREIVASYGDAVMLLGQNPWKLEDSYYNQLVSLFLSDPDYNSLNSKGQRFAAQQEADRQAAFKRQQQQEAAKKMEEERKRQEQENAKKLEAIRTNQQNQKPAVKEVKKPEVKAEVKPEPPKKVSPLDSFIPPIMREKYPEITNYISNCGRFNNLHSSFDEKASCIFEITRQVTEPTSIVGREIGGNSVRYCELLSLIINM